MRRARSAFTLVEILIVVIILGILAADVAQGFGESTIEAASRSTVYELEKLRRAVDVYKLQNGQQLPNVVAGNGTWGEIVSTEGAYLTAAPLNSYVGGPNSRVISIGAGPDGAFHTDYGWIYDDLTGSVWAASFDANDMPYPK
jgi:prepilin-type N-terminal cleavage/methylation domain-containing protein